MKELVSVIMSEHNSNLQYLNKSIDSILNQTYTNFELIIVDDKTSEENKKYLYKLQSQNNKIKLISNKKRIGLAASLNKAIESSNGDYIFRMDTDDIAFSNRLEQQMKILKNGYSITTARAILIDSNDNEVGKTKYLPFYNLSKRIQLYYFFLNGVIHPLIAAKKEVFSEFRYDENVKYGQDFELWLRMSRKYTIYFNRSILLKYRVPSSKENKLFYQYKIHKEVAQRYIGYNPIKKVGFYFSDKKYKKLIYNKLKIDRKIFEEKISRI